MMRPNIAALHTASDPTLRSRAWGKLRQPLGASLLVLAAAAAVALWTWRQGAEGRAIQALPAGDRQLVYDRTMQNLHALCTDQKRSLRVYCRREAAFALNFPECDASCRELAGRILPSGRAVR
jgi:hypothetical protein